MNDRCPLTIGFAVYNDFDGAWFTLQALAIYHPRVRYLVVDNAPAADRHVAEACHAVGGAYYHRPDLAGTSASRDAVFRLARTEWVCCLDAHVLIEPGGVRALLDYIEDHAGSRDLLGGPLVYDNGDPATHLRPAAPPGYWGTWDKDADALARGKPFEVPAQGLGLFAMRKAAWPGFHPLFRGFGVEEGYIHEKVRRNGGKCLCLPALGWRHRFRDQSSGSAPVPYPLLLGDKLWNLLIGHRELGLHADEQIKAHHAPNHDPADWQRLTAAADAAQPFGKPCEVKRQRLLGVWYTNNAAPLPLLQRSLATVQAAVAQTMRHDVRIITSAWESIPDNPFDCSTGRPPNRVGHAAIVEQIERARGYVKDDYPGSWDVLCFLEHDVLYPPGYFDAIGDAFALNPAANVVSNLDYMGMNETGWLAVRERHEPMHQLSMRREKALDNLERCKAECYATGGCLLEPQGDRGDWYRLPVRGFAPAVHVNHPHRFTSHGEVCYEARSGGKIVHPYWGDYRQWWPLEARPDTGGATMPCGGCPGNQASGPLTPPPFDSLEGWFTHVRGQPSDFNEHMETLRDLAARSEVCVELSGWLKPSLLALAAGKPKMLRSICPGQKPEWGQFKQLHDGPADFQGIQADTLSAEPFASDLLLIDMLHRAPRLYAELERWAPLCRRYLVVHCTETYGEDGDDGTVARGGPGVLPALRHWVREHPEWGVVQHYPNNHGLTVLSCHPDDRPEVEPGAFKRVFNFAAAMTKWKASGLPVLGEEEAGRRLDVCALCPQRVPATNQCSKCGCPLVEGAAGQPGKAFVPTEECPLGKWPAPATSGGR